MRRHDDNAHILESEIIQTVLCLDPDYIEEWNEIFYEFI